ncbi:toll/interleukin-1 receptor domain-containing protein [Bernardetia sp. ABR2-2B]|uniref:toll/interleukin-1 receptor domain-containing protein n=1 Tax=Bernardetia sp. ABR2-2B TaxID=3127472 RepID=UPI0030CBA954
MTEKIAQLKKQVEAGKFQEVFDYLDLYFEENPYYQYSNLKQNISFQMSIGNPPNPMQVQSFLLFLNSSKIKEVVPIIEQNNKTTIQKTTETMAYGTETEIKGIKKAIDLLLEKQEFLSEELGIASGNQKFSLKKQLQQLETELETYRQKIQKLKGENPSNSELKDLDTKTQKVQEGISESLKEEKKTSAFISYNHKDKIVANKIKDFLRTKGVDVTIDSEAMKAGEDIKTFIEKCVRENDITLSLVSKNSLLSAWVAMESVLTFAGEKLANKEFIAVYEDDSFFKRSFTDDALDKVEEEILDISTTIQKRLSKNRRIEDLQNDLSRYRELENNLPQIVGRLRNSLCIDISGDNFDNGLQKVCDDIK